MNKFLSLIAGFLCAINITAYYVKSNPDITLKQHPSSQQQIITFQLARPIELPLQKPQITTLIPNYLPYNQLVAQLDTWAKQAPFLAETGVYGKTSHNQNLHYIRITNRKSDQPKKTVLITAAIHGNEPLSTTVVMAYIGTLLGTYGEDSAVTKLLDTRDIYFVPVVSPDSYPNSRYVDGVDPNRNFPRTNTPNHISVMPILNLQRLFLQIKPNAVMSGHTHGRVFLTPYGDTNRRCPHEIDFLRIIGQMQKLTGYRHQHACEMYGHPILGGEVDWFYRNGPLLNNDTGKNIKQGAFAIVCEFGTHQHIPSMNDIQTEFDRTFKGFLYFCQESPLVKILWEEAPPINEQIEYLKPLMYSRY